MKKMLFLFLVSLFLSACTSKEISQPSLFIIKPVKNHVLTKSIDSYSNDFQVMENGKVGIINLSGKLVIDPIYHAIYTTASGELLSKKDQGYDLIRDYSVVEEFQSTMKILEEDYDSYLFEEDLGLWRVRKNGKRAYVDMSGKQLSKTMYERISPMSMPGDGDRSIASNLFLSFEKIDNQYYCAIHAMDGTQIVPPVIMAHNYENNLYCFPYQAHVDWDDSKHGRAPVAALIVEENYKYDVYLVDGTKLIDDADIANFVWNQDVINYEKNGNFYVMNFDGVIVENQRNITIKEFTIQQKDGYYGVEKTGGEVLLPYQYETIEPMFFSYDNSEDFFLVRRNGKKLVVDSKGNELFEYSFFGILSTMNPNFWIAVNKSGQNQILNQKGDILINEWFEYIEIGYFVICHTTNGYRVYDQNLTLLYESKQADNSPFLGNIPFYLVKENQNTMIKDASGNTLGNYLYQWKDTLFFEKDSIIYAKSGDIELILDEFDQTQFVFANIQGVDGLFLMYDNKIQFFDSQLHSYYSLEVDSIQHAGSVLLEDYGSCQYFIVEKNGKFALILESGEYLTDFAYDEFKYINSYGFIAVLNDNLLGVMNYRGELVVDFVYDPQILKNDRPCDGTCTAPDFFIGEWYQTYLEDYRSNFFVRNKTSLNR